jgi:hypothetical protein
VTGNCWNSFAGVRDPFAPPQAAAQHNARRADAAASPESASYRVDASSATAHVNPPAVGLLAVVNPGVMAINQVTVEARGWIEAADHVLCSNVDPATAEWIASLNANVQFLDSHAIQVESIQVESILAESIQALLEKGLTVCAVHSGDPAPWGELIRACRARGYRAVVAPGISTEDCFFSDLGLDPLQHGVQIFRAADFLGRHIEPEVSAGLVLRKVLYTVEGSEEPAADCCDPALIKALTRTYGEKHTAILYEPALYSVCDPVIRRYRIGHLHQCPVTARSNFYIPPRGFVLHGQECAEEAVATVD